MSRVTQRHRDGNLDRALVVPYWGRKGTSYWELIGDLLGDVGELLGAVRELVGGFLVLI